jgi:hypothetical protein
MVIESSTNTMTYASLMLTTALVATKNEMN